VVIDNKSFRMQIRDLVLASPRLKGRKKCSVGSPDESFLEPIESASNRGAMNFFNRVSDSVIAKSPKSRSAAPNFKSDAPRERCVLRIGVREFLNAKRSVAEPTFKSSSLHGICEAMIF